ncbi:hypothetical protein ACTFIR_000222 [Dictyostelium discoideum]
MGSNLSLFQSHSKKNKIPQNSKINPNINNINNENNSIKTNKDQNLDNYDNFRRDELVNLNNNNNNNNNTNNNNDNINNNNNSNKKLSIEATLSNWKNSSSNNTINHSAYNNNNNNNSNNNSNNSNENEKNKILKDSSNYSFYNWRQIGEDNLQGDGKPPSCRYAHTMTAIGTNIYIFGGYNGIYLNDVHCFDTINKKWNLIQTTGPTPIKRAFHSSWVYGKKLYIYAGFNGKLILNDLYSLDIDSMEWKLEVTGGVQPKPRFEHTTSLIGNSIYLFGGANDSNWLSDIHILNLEDKQWRSIATPIININENSNNSNNNSNNNNNNSLSPPPPKRCAHSSCVGGNSIFIFGGYDGGLRLNSIYEFDTIKKRWYNLHNHNSKKMGRAAHSCSMINGSMISFGGFEGTKRLNDLSLFNTQKKEWRPTVVFGQPPSIRSYHSSCVIDNKMYIFGGFGELNRLNDLFILEPLSCLYFISNVNCDQEVHMALLLEGQVDDLGINYEVNQGLAETEALIQRAAKVINDANSYDSTYDNIKSLLDQDNPYNLIITSSESQMSAALDIASDYEDTYFLIFGDMGDKKVPHSKVGTYYFNLVSPHFVLGFIAGGMGKSVGMVVPGPPTENYFTANAFYAGMKYYTSPAGAPNPSLSVVATSSYDDYDTATGAGRILLTKDIDICTQSQTDMTVANMFLNASKWAFGTNGFPQSNIYGNRIIQSVVHDFQVPFYEAADMVMKNTWKNGYKFFGDFNNDFFYLDYYSFLVDPSLKNQTEDLISTIKGGAKPYITNGLTYEKILEQTKLSTGITDLGYYAVPTTEVYTTGSINKTFMAVSILEMAICLIIGVVVIFFFSRNINIIYSTIPYCLTILLGASLIAVAIFLWNLRDLNTQICTSKIWMASLGYNVLIGFIIIKSSLIYFKFKEMVKSKNEKISPIPFGRIVLWFVPLLIIDCVLLIIYSTSGNPGKIDSLGLDGIGRYEYTQNCVNNLTGDIILYIILVFHGLQLLYGCVIAWKTRVIDLEEFIEAHDFATAIYLITFCSFIIVILMVGVTSTSNRNTIISACAIFSSFSCVLIIFGAKFWKIYKPVEDDGLPQIKLKPQKSYSGSGGSGNSSGSKSKKTSAHSSTSGVKSGTSAPTQTSQSAMASINIQNFVNPIEASSRAAAQNDN